MTASREVITIQAGNYANFIGTHWWNIQESSFCFSPDATLPLDINHDIMFREGLNLQGEVTYTPRLVLIDVASNFSSIRRESSLYRVSNKDVKEYLWDGPVEVIKEDTVKKNPYLEESGQPLESSKDGSSSKEAEGSETSFDFNSPETNWSEYLKTHLHPKSYCPFQEDSSDINPFDLYSYGEEVYLKDGRDVVEEALRKLTEECDYLQGFHLLFDAHNGFSGITMHVLQYLDEEYKRIPSLCFPVYQTKKSIPIVDIKEQMSRLYAVLNSMSQMNASCSMFTPLSISDDIVKYSSPFRSFPYLQYNESLLYHTSAIFAASIETLTSSYRLKSAKFNMGDITSLMATYGRKLVCSSVCLPFPLSHNSYLSAMVEKDVSEYHMTSLTPFYNPGLGKTLFQSSVLRGVPESKFHKTGKSIYNSTTEEVFGEYLNKYSPSSVTTATVFSEMVSVDSPFPKLFNSAVSANGFLNTSDIGQEGANKVPVAGSFNSSDSSGDFIEDILCQSSKLSFKEYAKCTESNYEKDNFVEVIENLHVLKDNYQNY